MLSFITLGSIGDLVNPEEMENLTSIGGGTIRGLRDRPYELKLTLPRETKLIPVDEKIERSYR